METINVNIETPEIRVDVVQNEPPVVVVNVERQVIETVAAPVSRPVTVEARAGKNGERGERGGKGERGDKGEPGKDGANGKDGPRGERGEKGERGDAGADGERGAQGIKGDKGDRGEKGERGEQGKEGKEGQRGRDGKDGAKGEKGDKGEPGERGEKGRDGKDGIGFPGPPGKQGPPGNSAPHTHPLSEIEQSGATDGQVPIWDDGAGEWIPGNAPGGGASIIEKTYAEMAAHIAADELTPGQWYNITDAAGTDLGFICLALTENEISVSGSGGYLNADFQSVGNYDGVAAETGTAAGTQLGIWRTGFEAVTIPYTNLAGGTFAVGETITGSVTGATAVIVTDDGAISMTAYMTSPGVGFDGSEVLDNGAGVTADMDGAAGTPTIVEGDIVIWDLKHWQLTDATVLDGTDPATNTAAYTELARTVADVGYIEVWDITEFDFPNNWLSYYQDLLGNKIRYDKSVDDNQFSLGFSAITIFPKGNSAVYLNISTNGLISQQNFRGGIFSNTLQPFSIISLNVGSENAYIFGNYMDSYSEIKQNTIGAGRRIHSNFLYNGGAIRNNILTDGEGDIFANTIGVGANIQSCTLGDAAYISTCEMLPSSNIESSTFGDNSLVENNILENGASMTGITAGAGCSISRNKIGQGATMGGSTTMGDGATMDDLEIRANKQLSNKTLDAGVTFSDKILEITIDGTETITANIEGNKAQPGFSDIPKSFDATGLTTLDWLAENNYVGIGNLSSSNATEAIDTISNFPTAFPFLLRPAAGLTLTVTGTAIASIGAGQIALTTADVVLNGDNGEWLELEADPNGGGFLREKNRSATLI